jgi:peptidase M48-like protein/PDZ domain-containing protein
MKPTAPRAHRDHFGAPMAAVMLSLLAVTGCVSPVTPPIHVEPESVDQETKLQRELRFRMAYEQQQRVVRVTFPMLTAGAEMCEAAVHYVTGMSFSNRRSYEYGSEAIAILGLTDEVKVTSVIHGSPADLAGVRVDDLLIQVDGSAVGKGAGAVEALQARLQELLKAGRPFRVTLARDGVLQETSIVPVRACAFSTVATDGDVVNAFADGSTVTVTVGMLRFVQDDTELALVVSHELAHNLMQHVAAKSNNEVVGVLMRVAIIATAIATRGASGPNPQVSQLASAPMPSRTSFSREFEAEADYVGLYMMARTGLLIDRAPQFWRRMGAAYPASNQSAFGASHPTDAYRMLALEETVREIQRKIGEGVPLVPERGKSSFKKPGEAHAGAAAGSTAAYRITFLLDHRSSTGAGGEMPDVVGGGPLNTSDPLAFEEKVNRCLAEAMRRVAPSTRVMDAKDFRRVAFPDLGPSEAPHTVESLLALRSSATFQRRVAPLGLQYVGVVTISTDLNVGSGYMAARSGESRFSVSVIDVGGGQALPFREDSNSWRSTGPGNLLGGLVFFNTDSEACAQLGERLAGSLASRSASPLSVRDGHGP